MSSPQLIGLDWGTSSLRVYDLTASTPIELANVAMGIKRFDDRDGYASYLDGLLSDLAINPATIIMSGMITSQQGWIETPYLPTPVSASQLASGATSYQVDNRAIWALPGASHSASSGIDVMRGEETQIVGATATEELSSATLLLPGTHSKWARFHEGAIVEFATFITGELFELVSQHSIIGAVIEGSEPDSDAFDRGIRVGLDQAEVSRGLLNSLFSVRTEGLLNPSSRTGLHSYLSGLLIGSEIADASQTRADNSHPVIVIGTGALVAAYRRALELAGITTAASPPHSASLGLKHIANLIGIT